MTDLCKVVYVPLVEYPLLMLEQPVKPPVLHEYCQPDVDQCYEMEERSQSRDCGTQTMIGADYFDSKDSGLFIQPKHGHIFMLMKYTFE